MFEANINKFDQVINDIMSAGNAAGLAAAVVDKNGSLIFEKGITKEQVARKINWS